MNKYIKVNRYNNPFPQYVPVGEKKESKFWDIAAGILIVGMMILFLWALSYTACMAQYHSAVCKDNLLTELIFKLIK